MIADNISFDPFDLDIFAKNLEDIIHLNKAKPEDGGVTPNEDPDTYEDDVIEELEWVRKVLIKSRDILNAYKRMCDVFGFPKKEDQLTFLDEVSKIKHRTQDEICDAYYKKVEYRNPADDIPQSPEQIIDEVQKTILPFVRQNFPEYTAMDRVLVSPMMYGGHSTSVTLSTKGANFGSRYKTFEACFDVFSVLEFVGECDE